ncbi:hypothetical protein GQ457_15G000010 [Hibiscus cannabinus]
MPTVEEYTELLRVPNIRGDRVYTKPERGTNFGACLKDLVGRNIQWATGLIKKKEGFPGFSWSCIAEITRTYPDPHKKAQLLAVAIYGFVIFLRILGYIDVVIPDLFNQLEHGINPVPAILAETFISLNACRELERGRFRGCTPMLMVRIKSLFWKTPKTVLPGIGSMYFSPLKEFLVEQWEEVDPSKWVEAFRNLQEQDLVWRTPWLRTRSFLYRCYEYNWLMLLGLWGGIGCAPLSVSRQFISFTQGLSESEFAFEGESKRRLTRST